MNSITNKEYHKNGQLSYIETIQTIENDPKQYPNSRINDKGFYWIRTGLNAKYHDNGVLAWSLTYDNFGNVIESNTGFRKDGTKIIY